MYSDPQEYCRSHSPHLVYRPKGVLLDRKGRHTLSYKPFCSTTRFWEREKTRCSKYHGGHAQGRCECWTAGCMAEHGQCVPYDERSPASQNRECELNHGLMTMCATHLPGGTQESNWREGCLRENGFRCRLDGASRSDRQSIACVPNSDPSGMAHVPERLTRDPSIGTIEKKRVRYYEEGGVLRKNDLARMRDPNDSSRWLDVMVQQIRYNPRGLHSYHVVVLENNREYDVPEDELLPMHTYHRRHAYDSSHVAAEKMWKDVPQAGEQVTLQTNKGHGYAATVLVVDRQGLTLQYRDGYVEHGVMPSAVTSRTWKDAIPEPGQRVVLRTGEDRGQVVRVLEADLSGITVKHPDKYVQRVFPHEVEHYYDKNENNPTNLTDSDTYRRRGRRDLRDLSSSELQDRISLLRHNLQILKNRKKENSAALQRYTSTASTNVPCRSNQTLQDCDQQDNCEYTTQYGCVEKPVFLSKKKDYR